MANVIGRVGGLDGPSNSESGNSESLRLIDFAMCDFKYDCRVSRENGQFLQVNSLASCPSSATTHLPYDRFFGTDVLLLKYHVPIAIMAWPSQVNRSSRRRGG